MTDYMKTKAVKGASSGNKKGGQGGNAGGGGGKGKKKKDRSSSNARTYARDIAYCQAVQSMCGGYFKVNPFVLLLLLEEWNGFYVLRASLRLLSSPCTQENRRNIFFFFEVNDDLTTADV